MKKYTVGLERNGEMVPVGEISGTDYHSAVFSYLESYLSEADSVPISISLPLQREPFSPAQTRNFFEGLLPEGFTRRSVAQWMHLDEDDYLSILHGLGRECLGAVRISEDGETTEASYEKITEHEVRELAAEGASKSTDLVTKAHLSLTGATGKVGLYFDKTENAWYLPKGTAPSTHIVKQSHIRLREIVTNEQLCMQTAQKCGIEVPESFIINMADGRDDEVLFATKRYDRVFAGNASVINGLPRPLRLHQEDFAQAMGIPSSGKYENDGEHHMKRMFDLLRVYSSDPIGDRLRLWNMIVFHYLIGNTDAHIKNFSLLYSANAKGIRLAPAYDIVSTSVYESSTRDMAFRIGGDHSIDNVSRKSFRAAAGECGIGEKMAMKRFDGICGRFRQALDDTAEELREDGFTGAPALSEKILATSGFRKL